MLAEHQPSRKLPIASTTKLMTAYLTLKNLKLNKLLPAAAYTPTSSAEVVLGLKAGEKLTVRDLLYAMLLPSANDAAVTLADGVAGSTKKFVVEMNRGARALGLRHTHYENPIGLDSPGNYSSAGDLIKLTQALREKPTFRRIVDTPSITLHSGDEQRTVTTRDELLLKYPWITGVKTGHTLQAGYVLVSSGTQKGATLISAVLGAPSEADRDSDALKLLDYGFSLYSQQNLVKRGEVLAATDVRWQGEELKLRAAKPLIAGTRKGQNADVDVKAPDEVEGPVKAGEKLGVAKATVDGRPVGKVALLAAHHVGKATFLDKVGSYLPIIAIAVVLLVVIAVVVVRIQRRRRRRARSPEDRMRHQQERMRRREERS